VNETKFGTIPSPANYKIPFNLNDQSLTEWLTLLSLEQSYFSCQEISHVLATIGKLAIIPEQLFVFLNKISAHLNELVTKIEPIYLESSFPLGNEAQASLDMVINCYAILAKNYFLLGKKLLAENQSRQQWWCLYLALSSAGRSILTSAEGYLKPIEGFWLFCYEIFAFAENHNLLTQAITDANNTDKKIETVFKLILLFDKVDTNLFRPQEMKAIYAVLKNFSEHVYVKKKYDLRLKKGQFVFNLNEDKRPTTLAEITSFKDPGDRYFSPTPVTEYLFQYTHKQLPSSSALDAINPNLIAQLLKSLNLSKKRKFKRTIEHRHSFGIIGFNNIANFLKRKSLVAKDQSLINKISTNRIFGNWSAPDQNYPEGDEWLEKMMEMSFHDALLAHNNLNPSLNQPKEQNLWSFLCANNDTWTENIPVGEFEVLNSSEQGFHVTWQAADLKVKIGNIFAIPAAQGNAIHIGFIRRINRSKNGNIRLSIELVGFECEIVEITRQPYQFEGILLPGNKSLKLADSIICSKRYVLPNEQYLINRASSQKLCKIDKILHSTSSMCHIKIKYCA
jgi:cyclic-di-GMP-binding protein